MSRDKRTEIEKITDVLDKCTYDNELKDEMALMLYNAGYRKTADVAEKIFVEVEKWLANDGDIRLITAEKFAELKKKYESEDTE